MFSYVLLTHWYAPHTEPVVQLQCALSSYTIFGMLFFWIVNQIADGIIDSSKREINKQDFKNVVFIHLLFWIPDNNCSDLICEMSDVKILSNMSYQSIALICIIGTNMYLCWKKRIKMDVVDNNIHHLVVNEFTQSNVKSEPDCESLNNDNYSIDTSMDR